jgi:Putative bacterial sensory transduction regulator
MSDRAAAEAAVLRWAEDSQVEALPGSRPGEYVVELPGEAKLRTGVSLLIGDRALSASAFVMRHPDENHIEFYRWLLTRNSRLPGVAFALDKLGDVFLVGRIPLAGVSVQTLDELLGTILTASDGSFNDLLALGFLSSMRREWAWRIDRGESTRNLDAFRHLLTDGGVGLPNESPDGRVGPPDDVDVDVH